MHNGEAGGKKDLTPLCSVGIVISYLKIVVIYTYPFETLSKLRLPCQSKILDAMRHNPIQKLSVKLVFPR